MIISDWLRIVHLQFTTQEQRRCGSTDYHLIYVWNVCTCICKKNNEAGMKVSYTWKCLIMRGGSGIWPGEAQTGYGIQWGQWVGVPVLQGRCHHRRVDLGGEQVFPMGEGHRLGGASGEHLCDNTELHEWQNKQTINLTFITLLTSAGLMTYTHKPFFLWPSANRETEPISDLQ